MEMFRDADEKTRGTRVFTNAEGKKRRGFQAGANEKEKNTRLTRGKKERKKRRAKKSLGGADKREKKFDGTWRFFLW
jgi:hypothetical protein